MTDDQILLEMDYTTYGHSCRDAAITTAGTLVECRRQHGHDGEHAVRYENKEQIYRWGVEP